MPLAFVQHRPGAGDATLTAMASAPLFNVVKTDLRAYLGRRGLGIVLTGLGIGAVVVLALRSTSKAPLAASEAGLLTVVAAIMNVLAAMAFSRIGVVAPQHARGSVRRLLTSAQLIGDRITALESAPSSSPEAALLVSSTVPVLQATLYQIKDSINDWGEVHGEALAEVLRQANEQH